MKVVFIDRDGTMGGGYNIEYPTEYKAFDFTKAAFTKLKENGFMPIVFTNQSCIARGKDLGYDFELEFKEVGAFDFFLCPHDDKDNCNCRKPKTGLLELAREKYRLDMSECFVIGDRWSDMVSGGKMGCRLVLVLTGRGNEALGIHRDKWKEYEPDFVAENLMEATEWLCENK